MKKRTGSSWHRTNAERSRTARQSVRDRTSNPRLSESTKNVKPYSLVRRLTGELDTTVSLLLPNAIEQLPECHKKHFGKVVLSRGMYTQSTPGVTILGAIEMSRLSEGGLTLDRTTYLEDLSDRIASSGKHLGATVIGSGFFGYAGNELTKLGITFDAETTQTLKAEHIAAARMLVPDYDHPRRYPHVSIGQVVVHDDVAKQFLKHTINEMVADMPMRLAPVRAGHAS